MIATKDKKEARARRHKRIRAKAFGTEARPRFSVFKSNRYVYVQLIDDENRKTMAHVSSMNMKGKTQKEKAREVGRELAKKAASKKLKDVVFDRGGFIYTGIIKEVAEGAREGGLSF